MIRFLGTSTARWSLGLVIRLPLVALGLLSFFLVGGCAAVPTYSGTWRGHIAPMTVYDSDGHPYQIAAVHLEEGTQAPITYAPPSSKSQLALATKKNCFSDDQCVSLENFPSGTLVQVTGVISPTAMKDPGGRRWVGPLGSLQPQSTDPTAPDIDGGTALHLKKPIEIIQSTTATNPLTESK